MMWITVVLGARMLAINLFLLIYLLRINFNNTVKINYGWTNLSGCFFELIIFSIL